MYAYIMVPEGCVLTVLGSFPVYVCSRQTATRRLPRGLQTQATRVFISYFGHWGNRTSASEKFGYSFHKLVFIVFREKNVLQL